MKIKKLTKQNLVNSIEDKASSVIKMIQLVNEIIQNHDITTTISGDDIFGYCSCTLPKQRNDSRNTPTSYSDTSKDHGSLIFPDSDFNTIKRFQLINEKNLNLFKTIEVCIERLLETIRWIYCRYQQFQLLYETNSTAEINFNQIMTDKTDYLDHMIHESFHLWSEIFETFAYFHLYDTEIVKKYQKISKYSEDSFSLHENQLNQIRVLKSSLCFNFYQNFILMMKLMIPIIQRSDFRSQSRLFIMQFIERVFHLCLFYNNNERGDDTAKRISTVVAFQFMDEEFSMPLMKEMMNIIEEFQRFRKVAWLLYDGIFSDHSAEVEQVSIEVLSRSQMNHEQSSFLRREEITSKTMTESIENRTTTVSHIDDDSSPTKNIYNPFRMKVIRMKASAPVHKLGYYTLEDISQSKIEETARQTKLTSDFMAAAQTRYIKTPSQPNYYYRYSTAAPLTAC
jgi:hypothetical protein